MNILQHLTLRHLMMNKKRTLITIIGIVLSVAMITAISSLVVSFQDMIYRDAVAKDGLWHVRYFDLDGETMEEIIQAPIFSQWEIMEDEEFGPVLYLQFKKLHKGIFDESEALCFQYGIAQESVSYHNSLLIAEGIVPGPYYDALYTFAAILLLLVAIGSVLVIANAFTISTDERTKQFGLLKSTGATHKQVRGMVLFEGLALAVIGIPLGILVGFGAVGCALFITNYILDQIAVIAFAVKFRIVVSPLAIAVSVAGAIVTILLSAWLPARKAGKISPVEAIRQTTAIQLSRRNVLVLPWTKKLFGFEGVLAAKTMKRSRRRYRTAVISLVVSIVLVIAVSSFGQTLIKATSMVYEDLGSNGTLYLYHEDREVNEAIYQEINSWDGAEVGYSRQITGGVELADHLKTAQYLQKYTARAAIFEGETTYRIFTMDPDSMAVLASLQGCDFLTEPYDGISPVKTLLVNTTGTIISQGRRMSFTPFKMPLGTRIELHFTDVPLEIAGEIDYVPMAIYPQFSGTYLNVIISEDAFYHLRGEAYHTDHMTIPVNAVDIAAFEDKALSYVSGILPEYDYLWSNYEAAMANNRQFTYLVMAFVYGFIAMLSLIAITSVITTISTGIALRKGELAMLRSIGMTDRAMEKMLNYENLLYGLKALLFGIPLGFGASVAMYKAIQMVMDFEFVLPVSSALISAAAVFLLTLATQKYAKAKVKSANIAESLRDGNI